jgi:hypothetical protein
MDCFAITIHIAKEMIVQRAVEQMDEQININNDLPVEKKQAFKKYTTIAFNTTVC